MVTNVSYSINPPTNLSLFTPRITCTAISRIPRAQRPTRLDAEPAGIYYVSTTDTAPIYRSQVNPDVEPYAYEPNPLIGDRLGTAILDHRVSNLDDTSADIPLLLAYPSPWQQFPRRELNYQGVSRLVHPNVVGLFSKLPPHLLVPGKCLFSKTRLNYRAQHSIPRFMGGRLFTPWSRVPSFHSTHAVYP
jgi:hypothetical protein